MLGGVQPPGVARGTLHLPMHASLADYLEALEKAGELRRVTHEVDADLEMAALTVREAEAGGPALFFQNVRGQRLPVATNLLGSERRLCLALGVDSLAEAAERVALWLAPAEPEAWIDKLKPPTSLVGQAKSPPRVVKTGLCQQVVRLGRDVNLAELPALRSWPQESGCTITAGRIWTRDPETGARAVDIAPVEVLDGQRLGIVWHEHHRGSEFLARHRDAGTPLPVAISLGGDPLSELWAAPLPRELDPFSLASLLRGKPLELVRCRTHELEVPTDSDLIIEGTTEPASDDGPTLGGALAGDNGYLAVPRPLAVIQVTAVTQRINPIFPAVVRGAAVGEANVVAVALARFLLPVVRRAIPELVDYSLPSEGGPGGAAVLAIRKSYPMQAHKAAAAFWGLELTMCRKLVIVVDEHVDVHDAAAVLRAVAANVHPGRDAAFHPGPAHPLDHAAPTPLVGQHLCLDATAKLPGEHPGPWPARLARS